MRPRLDAEVVDGRPSGSVPGGANAMRPAPLPLPSVPKHTPRTGLHRRGDRQPATHLEPLRHWPCEGGPKPVGLQGFRGPATEAAHAGAEAPGGPQSLLQCSNQNVPRIPTVTVRPGSYMSLTAFGNAKYERRSSPVRFSTLKVSCGCERMFFSV